MGWARGMKFDGRDVSDTNRRAWWKMKSLAQSEASSHLFGKLLQEIMRCMDLLWSGG